MKRLGVIALVLGLLGSAVLALAGGPWWPLVGLAALWAAALTVVAISAGRLAGHVLLAGAIMHLGYGVGLVVGIVRGPGPVRRALARGAQEPR